MRNGVEGQDDPKKAACDRKAYMLLPAEWCVSTFQLLRPAVQWVRFVQVRGVHEPHGMCAWALTWYNSSPGYVPDGLKLAYALALTKGHSQISDVRTPAVACMLCTYPLHCGFCRCCCSALQRMA